MGKLQPVAVGSQVPTLLGQPANNAGDDVLEEEEEDVGLNSLRCWADTLGTKSEDVPVVELCILYLHACQVRVTVSNSGLCFVFVWRILSIN